MPPAAGADQAHARASSRSTCSLTKASLTRDTAATPLRVRDAPTYSTVPVDGRQLQRVGLQPDIVIAPTLAGIRAGKDEVLDRAAGSRPQWREQADEVNRFRLRYLDAQGAWQEQWPPRESVAELLPRAVEFSIALEDLGELRRVIALPGTIPTRGVGANGTPVQGSLPPVANPLPSPQL